MLIIGAYNPDQGASAKKSPFYSFAGKYQSDKGRLEVPGPGSYDKPSTVNGIPSSKFNFSFLFNNFRFGQSQR